MCPSQQSGLQYLPQVLQALCDQALPGLPGLLQVVVAQTLQLAPTLSLASCRLQASKCLWQWQLCQPLLHYEGRIPDIRCLVRLSLQRTVPLSELTMPAKINQCQNQYYTRCCLMSLPMSSVCPAKPFTCACSIQGAWAAGFHHNAR